MIHEAFGPLPIRSLNAATALFRPMLAGLAAERLCVAHLDHRARLLTMSVCPLGTDRDVRVPLRDILRDALEHGACEMILAHNHPSGDPRPSEADRRTTRRVADCCRDLDIRVVDHLVFAGDAVVSLRVLGMM